MLVHADDSVLFTDDGRFFCHFLTPRSLPSSSSSASAFAEHTQRGSSTTLDVNSQAFVARSVTCLYAAAAVPPRFNSTVADAVRYGSVFPALFGGFGLSWVWFFIF